MCGIAGFTQFSPTVKNSEVTLHKMGEAILHRGPDSHGIYVEDQIGLCHRRLSIIDLSETGHQPMKSHNGRYITVYNGEIYNFKSLRNELERDGIEFKGTSDTEVVITLFEKYGIDCLQQLNGMFSIAIWDTQEKCLFLARDRLGKKPLYYYQFENEFVFASEIKAILAYPGIDRTIRMDAVKDFFTYQYVPDPKSIFKHIHKLEPGYWMRIDNTGVKTQQYWDVSFANTTQNTQAAIEEELYSLLEDSVKLRMVSDVPLGAFLSGGVDSSAVVGLMAANSETPITSCSIGFDSEKFDEVVYAREIAKLFNTDHHEFEVRENVENNLINIASYFDEPFSDPSFVPTYFVSQLARQKVTVALAGDGGDENFAGYSKYKTDKTENQLRSLTPEFLRRSTFPKIAQALSGKHNTISKKGSSLLKTLSVDPAHGFFITNSFFSENVWNRLAKSTLKTELSDYDSSEITKHFYNKADIDDHLSKILYTDLKTYLPGDILVKVDRMSMANSLETRAPILDYRVVELAASIPAELKLKNKTSKYILKECFNKLLPPEILHRKKMGFSVPLRHWLQHEIRTITEKYLFAANSGIENIFDIDALKVIWNEHLLGQKNHSSELWSLLMFELWWQRYIE